MKTDLVVARYKEDLSWLNLLELNKFNLKIYSKSDVNVRDFDCIRLPNVGQEAHTFIYHIVENYDRLTEFTVFVQGEPFYHCTNIGRDEKIPNRENWSEQLEIMNKTSMTVERIIKYGRWSKTLRPFNIITFLHGNLKDEYLSDLLLHDDDECSVTGGHKYNFYNLYKKVFNARPNKIVTFAPGSQYCVSREKIRRHGLDFYNRLLELTLKDKNMPWAMERMWYHLYQFPEIGNKGNCKDNYLIQTLSRKYRQMLRCVSDLRRCVLRR